MNASHYPPADTNHLMPHRMAAMLVFLAAGFGGIGWRLHVLQVDEHQQWLRRSESMIKKEIPLPAMRGAILDHNRELLAHDKQIFEMWVNTRHLRDVSYIKGRLAAHEEKSPPAPGSAMSDEAITERYRTHVTRVLVEGMQADGLEVPPGIEQALNDTKRVEFALVKGLTPEAADVWKARFEKDHVVGMTLRSIIRRFYPSPDRLTHVLGYVNEETTQVLDPATGEKKEKFVQVGREGIESVLNDLLVGTDGYQWIERDRKGREITSFRGEGQPPRHGHEVTLTIDMHLQDALEEVLQQAYLQYDPKSICAVLLEPKSGAVLAMGSRPHILRDTMKGTIANPAISAQYEPGSVFKIVAYTGALERRLAGLGEMINCDPNQKILSSQRIKDHVNGVVTVQNAFAQSSNRAAYLMARRMGDDSFLEYVESFGFGRRTGIALTGEISGTVWPRKVWDNLTFSRMAMGHAVTVTPLQMALAVGVIANGGTLMKPQIIKEIRDQDGKIVQQFHPEAVRRVCSDRTAQLMRQAMMEVVQGEKGTGKLAAVEDVLVAGKTGTSQRIREGGRGYEAGHYCVSFGGFAPADNPQLCAIIVVDDPKAPAEELYGGKLAAPIFAQLMKQSLHTIAVAHAGKRDISPLSKEESK